MKLLKHLKAPVARVIITAAYPLGVAIIVLMISGEILMRGSASEGLQKLLKELRGLTHAYMQAMRNPSKCLDLD